MPRHFSVDSVAVSGRRLFGWGWFLDTESRVRHAEFRVPVAGGGEAIVACLEGAARPDVAVAFPGVPHAAASGYMLLARLPAPVDPSRPSRFVAELVDGSRHEIEVPGFPAPARAHPTLFARIRRQLAERGPAGVLAAVRERVLAALQRRRARARSRGLARSQRPVVLCLDHALGGGANLYREGRIAELTGEGRQVLLVTPRLASLDYLLSLRGPAGVEFEWQESSLDAVLAYLRGCRIEAIELNNLVSFEDPLQVVGWCREAQATGVPLVFHLHDFHAVCPAFTLIDVGGTYCRVPGLEACRQCLPRNAANSLGMGSDVDLEAWRAAWGELLAGADRVVAFSQASADILRRGHPGLGDRLRVELRPHGTSHRRLRPVRAGGGRTLTVGVIGNISRPKGARIVEELADLARHRAVDLRIVVIGTLQTSRAADDVIHVHGPYEGDELPALLERYGVDLCLMPSVCPETYSYVTDEIMAMELPLAVFDIGAPAERVARYARGCVITDITAEAALAAIMRLARRGPADAGPQE